MKTAEPEPQLFAVDPPKELFDVMMRQSAKDDGQRAPNFRLLPASAAAQAMHAILQLKGWGFVR